MDKYKEIGINKVRIMESIEQRAKSHVEDCELQGKEARRAEFDYTAGAKEERILLTEWRDASKELPSTEDTVLGILQDRDKDRYVRTVSYSKQYGWLSNDVNDADIMLDWIKVLFWRPIHNFDPTQLYYGDDDGRAE